MIYAVYCRRSTDDKADNQANTLEWQKQAGLDFAKRHNLPLIGNIKGFCEDGVIQESHSGHKKAPLKYNKDGTIALEPLRPKFTRLVGMLVRGEIDGIIVKNWDRLSRNDQDSMVIKDLIDRKIADIRFIDAQYDHTKSSGKMHRNLDGAFSEFYSQQLSERITTAVTNLHEDGKCPHGAPVGYLDHGSDNKVLDPERASIIRDMFEMFATGNWGILPLTKWAQKQGLTSKPMRRKRTKEEIADGVELEDIAPTARPISKTRVAHMLKNPFYIGKVKSLKTGNWIDGKHPPLLIDEHGKANDAFILTGTGPT